MAEARYYAHPQNQFWRLLGHALDVDLTGMTYLDRLTTLLDRHVALWDVVRDATRPGSTDAAIRDHEPNALLALADTLPDLRAIAFNGGTALKHGRAALGPKARWPIIALPSSSPLHTIGIAAKQPAWDALASVLA